MATSDWVQTRDSIIFRAFRLAGIVPDDQQLNTQKLTAGATALESLVKVLQGRGRKLWTKSFDSIDTEIGTSEYALDEDTIEATGFFNSTDQMTVTTMSMSEFAQIPDKTQTGKPTCLWIDRQIGGFKINLWPIPDSVVKIEFVKTRRLYDFDTSEDTGDFPQHWIQPLTYALAADLANEYCQPMEERQNLRREALAFIELADDIDFPPDGEDSFIRGAY